MANRSLSIFFLLTVTLSAGAQQSFLTAMPAAQKERDMDRRLILETELADEYGALDKANSELDAHQTDEARSAVHRHKENIKALKRELDRNASIAPPFKAQRVVIKDMRPSTGADNASATGRFWDPYNRSSESSDSLTSPRRENHE
jgi:hypothetical protein